MKKEVKEVNLRCHPYRGILEDIKAETGMPTDQIHKGLFSRKNPNPKLAAIFNRLIEERESTVKQFRKNLRKAV